MVTHHLLSAPTWTIHFISLSLGVLIYNVRVKNRISFVELLWGLNYTLFGMWWVHSKSNFLSLFYTTLFHLHCLWLLIVIIIIHFLRSETLHFCIVVIAWKSWHTVSPHWMLDTGSPHITSLTGLATFSEATYNV